MDRKQDSPHIFPSLGLRTNRGTFHFVLEQKRRRVVIKRDKAKSHNRGNSSLDLFHWPGFYLHWGFFATLTSIKNVSKPCGAQNKKNNASSIDENMYTRSFLWFLSHNHSIFDITQGRLKNLDFKAINRIQQKKERYKKLSKKDRTIF